MEASIKQIENAMVNSALLLQKFISGCQKILYKSYLTFVLDL